MGDGRKPKRMTEKQRRFVEAYMGDASGNATEAARIAGYKGNERTLQMVGFENLRKPIIVSAIDERVAEDDSGLIASRKERQALLSSIMRGETQEVSIIEGEVIERKPSLKERMKALELLGKTQGDYIQRVEIDDASTPRVAMSEDALNDLLRGRGLLSDEDE